MIKDSVHLMQDGHRTIAKQLEYLRQLTSNYLTPADASTSYKNLIERMKRFENDLLVHIDLENNILFPMAIKMGEKYLENKQK